MDNPLDIGQSNPSAFKLFGMMQALKHSKQSLGMLHLEADTVISNKKSLLSTTLPIHERSNRDLSCSVEVEYTLPHCGRD